MIHRGEEEKHLQINWYPIEKGRAHGFSVDYSYHGSRQGLAVGRPECAACWILSSGLMGFFGRRTLTSRRGLYH